MSANVPVNTHSTRVDVIDSLHGRILCVADVRGMFDPPPSWTVPNQRLDPPLAFSRTGAISTLNSLAAQHDAIAIIHSGDFGFYGSLPPPPSI